MRVIYPLTKLVAALVGMFVASLGTAQALVIDNTYLFGTVVPGSPSNEPVESFRLQALVTAYNGGLTSGAITPTPEIGHTYTISPGVNVPAAPLLSPVVDETGNSGSNLGSLFSVNLGTGYTYLLVKWGNNDAFYYIGGLTGAVSVENNVFFNTNSQPLGGSHYVLYNKASGVPDNGMTLGLMGLALLGVVGLRKRWAIA